MGKEGAFILQLLAQLQGNNLSNEQVFTTTTNFTKRNIKKLT